MAHTTTTYINGVPIDVNQTDHTAQQIDDACRLVLSGAATRTNLLHNWYFPAPINQRGQTSYAGNTAYTADRWKISGSGVQVTLAGGELVLSASAYERVQQHLEFPERLSGQRITASALVRNPNGTVRLAIHNLTTGIGISSDTPASGTYQVASVTGTLSINAGDSVFVGLYPGAHDAATPRTAYFKAAKLELGDTQTLARKDAAGNWVLLDPPPDYGTELAKCRRYFRRIRGSFDHFGTGYFASASLAYLFCPIDVPMRINPTVTLNGTAYLWSTLGSGANAIQSTALSSSALGTPGNNCLYLSFSVSGASAGLPCSVQFRDANAYIDLDANL